ncbi:MAG: 2-amino-4-hydroxy-6-hydroxymethyldihydropteridine diphosphokinase [Gammaproteobacteria bacterium]|nr:2-amino-4-hydroxy-6-hydroxymethyldihydropteridine diphosphokinase [Gammaproteobacteria bacterium]
MESRPVTVYVALGSNLSDPEFQVRSAAKELNEVDGIEVKALSNLYLTPPMGPEGQADYVNGVAVLRTTLDPHDLLDALQNIEQLHHRQREVRWGPRTLDLDILLYGEKIIDTVDLVIPHPGIPLRAFVLYPLYEIDPNLQLPTLGSISSLIANCPDQKPPLL